MSIDDPDDFDLGDGTADTESTILCPYCGEENVTFVDPGSGPVQQYIEDCQVCCQPMSVYLSFDAEGHAHVDVAGLEE